MKAGHCILQVYTPQGFFARHQTCTLEVDEIYILYRSMGLCTTLIAMQCQPFSSSPGVKYAIQPQALLCHLCLEGCHVDCNE